MPFCTAWCIVGRAGSHTVRQIHTLTTPAEQDAPGVSRSYDSDIHRVKAPLSRRGTTGAMYVCSKGGARLI